MKQTMDSLAGSPACWWQDWRSGGDCLYDLPPPLSSPAWSRAPSSPHSSGRMSPVCESPPPSPRSSTPLGTWLFKGAETSGVPLTQGDQRSFALSSVKKDRNTYVALPRAEALQDNVYFTLRPKKSFSFSSLRYPRQRRWVPEDSSFSSCSTSHDELLQPSLHHIPGIGTCSCSEKEYFSMACLCPHQDNEGLPPPARILPRARLRRRSIAAPGELSLVSKGRVSFFEMLCFHGEC